jgi:hypothetical protein
MNPPKLLTGAGGTYSSDTETFNMYLTYAPCLPTVEFKARATTGSIVVSSVTELGLHSSNIQELVITNCDTAAGFTTTGIAPYSVTAQQ